MTYEEFKKKGGFISVAYSEMNFYKLGDHNGYFYEEEPEGRDEDPVLLRAEVWLPDTFESINFGGSDPLEDALKFIADGCPLDNRRDYGGYIE